MTDIVAVTPEVTPVTEPVATPGVEPVATPTETNYFNSDGTFNEGWQSTLPEGYRDEASLKTVNDGKVLAKNLRQEGFRLYSQGEIDKAIEKFSEMAERYGEIDYPGGIVPAYFSLGLLFEEKGDTEKARNYFLKVLEINPNGEWGWLQKPHGFPVAETLCNLMESYCTLEC